MMICVGFEVMDKCVYVYILFYFVCFYECICFVGELISEDYLVEVLDECYVKNGGIDIIYFEIIICVVFLVFVCILVDFILFEVGFGGCLDVINVIMFELLVIMLVFIDYE